MAVVNTLDEPYLNQLSLMLGIYLALILIPSKLKILCLAEHYRKNVKAQLLLPLEINKLFFCDILINLVNVMSLFEIGSFMWFSIWRKEHGAMQWKKDSYQMALMRVSGYI